MGNPAYVASIAIDSDGTIAVGWGTGGTREVVSNSAMARENSFAQSTQGSLFQPISLLVPTTRCGASAGNSIPNGSDTPPRSF
jgi:hypothetical protein